MSDPPRTKGHDPARVSPFANPRAAVPVAQALRGVPPPEEWVPPAELVPIEPADPQAATLLLEHDVPLWRVPAGGAAAKATVPLSDAEMRGASFDADLELGAAPKPAVRAAQQVAPGRGSPAAAPRAAIDAADPSAYFGGGTFDGDFGDGPSIDADHALPASGGDSSALDYFGSSTFGDDDVESFSQSNAIALHDEPGERARAVPRDLATAEVPWPRGRSPDVAAMLVDAVEIAIAADFGKPPSSALGAPLYAFRVLTRRRALGPVVEGRRQELVAAEAERDELLVELVRAVRGVVEKDDRLNRMLAPALGAERVATERGAALAGTNSEHERRVSEFDARRAEISNRVGALREREKAFEADVATKEEPFKKASVHLKRIHIELRSLSQVALNASKTGGTLAPDHMARVSSFEAQKDELEAKANALGAEVERARAPLLATQNEISTEEKAKRGIDAEHRQLDAAFQKQVGLRSEGLEEANRVVRDAFSEVGRAILAQRGAIPVDQSRLDAIAAADALVDRRTLEYEIHRRALDSHDPAVVKRGIGLAAGLVVGLILLFVLIAML